MVGSTRIDPHVKILDENIVDRAKARGLDGLVYAPHFQRFDKIKKTATAFSDRDFTVYPAREIFAGNWRNRKHVLVIGLSEPVPDFITLEGAMEEIARQDAIALVPHPAFLTVSLTAADIELYGDIIADVEIYNPKYLPWNRRRCQTIATEGGYLGFGSSYAHLPGSIGEVWTAFDAPIPDTETLQRAFEERWDRTVGRRDGLLHRLRCLGEFAHLGWENSWEKLDRVFLSGMEPTHPHHVAYGGRFDDVAVY